MTPTTLKLDPKGILTTCAACGTTNRLPFSGLERSTRCGKCKAALAAPSVPIEVPDAQAFDAVVSSVSIPVVVDFWAAWCGPCRMVAPEVQKVASHLAGRALVLKVDTDANQELSTRFGIKSIPTIGVFQNGREVNRVSGVQSASAIEAMIRK